MSVAMEDGWSCDWLDEVQVEKNGFETTFPSYSLHIGWGASINRWTEESKISSICSQTEIQDRFQEHWVSCGWVTRDGTEKAKNVGCFSNRKYSVCYAMLCYAKSLQLCPTLCDPIDGSHQAPPSLGFSRQEHWSGLPFPSPVHESEKWKRSRSVVSDS